MENEVKGKEYHIEGNGKVTIMNRPKAENLPRTYTQTLKADISSPVNILQ
jgi:hypothetical protein